MFSPHRKIWAHALPAALLLMAPFNLLASLAMDIYMPVVPAMPGILGTSPAVIQLTLSLYMIMLGVVQIAFGPLSDRARRRPVLLGGILLFAVASLLLAGASTALSFVMARVLQSIGAAAMLVALFATVRDVCAERPENAAVYGILNGMLAFVPALGPIVGAIVADHFGWRGIFVALGAAALIALPAAWLQWPETRRPLAVKRRGAWRHILRSPAFWTYTLASSRDGIVLRLLFDGAAHPHRPGGLQPAWLQRVLCHGSWDNDHRLALRQ